MNQTVLIYLMDPHCGWCFGFHKQAEQIFEHFSQHPSIECSVIPGGLFVPGMKISASFGEEKRPIGERIQKFFGVSINSNYFTKVLGTGWIDSEPACRAICLCNLMDPQKTLSFAHAISNAAFVHTRDISQPEVITEIANEHGLDTSEFEQQMRSKQISDELAHCLDFAHATQTGFPSFFLAQPNQPSIAHLGGANLRVEQLVSLVSSRIDDSEPAH